MHNTREIESKYSTFRQEIRDCPNCSHEPTLYFACVDVKHCFDSILQSKVFDIARAVLFRRDSYQTKKHWRIFNNILSGSKVATVSAYLINSFVHYHRL